MVAAIVLTTHRCLPLPADFSSLEKSVGDVFERWKNFSSDLNIRALYEPGNVFEGVLWGSFWGIGVWLTTTSIYKLLTVETQGGDRFFKIGSAVKNALSNFISLFGSTAYNIRWAHDAKILSLGQYAPLFKGLSYGASAAVNLIEGSWAVYNIHREKEAILAEASEAPKEKHKQRLCLSLMKLIEHVSMVAWAALGVAGIAAGIAISPWITFPLMTIGTVFAFGSFFYQSHIEGRKTPFSDLPT